MQNERKRRKVEEISNELFTGVPIIHGHENISSQSFLELYQKTQVVLFRDCFSKDDVKPENLFSSKDMFHLFQRLDKDKDSWCVENSSAFPDNSPNEREQQQKNFLRNDSKCNGYCSFMVQNDIAVKNDLLRKYLPATRLPFSSSNNDNENDHTNSSSSELSMKYGPCLWFFFGRNNAPNNNAPLKGRPSHTDSIVHDGTWHFQLSGKKEWYIRPTRELLRRWNKGETEEKGGKTTNGESKNESAGYRVECQTGDFFLINTRLWWHETQIPSSVEPSISYARDLYLIDKNGNADETLNEESGDEMGNEGSRMTNVDGLYAADDIEISTIIFKEDTMPDCELCRSIDPNCEIVELEDGIGAVVAIRDIKAGEFFSVAESSDEEDDSDEELSS